MNRTSIIYGPALITWDSATFYTQSDIVVEFGADFVEMPINQIGIASRRMSERMAKVTFTPSGEWNATTTAKLLPYASTLIGTSLGGATDKDMVITPLSGTAAITLKAAILTKMPQLIFSATKSRMGSVEFMCLGGLDDDWSVVSSLFSIASPGAPNLSGYTPGDLITCGVEAIWYDNDVTYAGFDPFESEDGFVVDFDLRLKPYSLDSRGIIDYRMDGLDVTVTATPVGPTVAQVLTAMGLQGSGAKRGRASTDIMSDFIIKDGEAEATIFTAHNMSLNAAPHGYGQRGRHGPLVWRSNRTLASNTLSPAFTIPAFA